MSKIIDGNSLAEYEPWNAPQVDDVSAVNRSADGAARVTVRDIEEIQQRAYEDGFSRGHQEGLCAAREEVRHLGLVLTRLQEPLADMDEQVLQELVSLVKSTTRQLVRREIRIAPEGIVAILREAINVLPSSAREIEIHMHPDDVKLVRNILSIDDDHPTWTLTEDPVLTQGDCRVVTENSQIDATLEGRLNAVISALLGGERDDDEDIVP